MPHPELTNRRFALAPLLELDPDAALPGGARLAEALVRLGEEDPVSRYESR